MTVGVKLSQVVYDALKWNIETQRLPSGLVLEVAPVAQLFRLSRTPVGIALKALSVDGLVREGPKRGFVVGDGEPFRQDPAAAGLSLPPAVVNSVTKRNWRSQFYPRVEREIAVCLPFGRFAISATNLARHYGVSRTIAHETLVRLERLGLVRQQRARWYAGPLTSTDLREHYEIRWVLEPLALQQAAPLLKRELFGQMRERAVSCLAEVTHLSIDQLDRIEHDLHEDVVLRCPNRQMAETIRRSQLPLMATNYSFQSRKGWPILRQTLVEHIRVLDALVEGDAAAAAKALEDHLRAALQIVRGALEAGALTWEPPSYMVLEN